MGYKIFYTDNNGIVYDDDGNMRENRKENSPFKLFESLDDAKVDCGKYIKQYPKLECLIVPEDKSEHVLSISVDGTEIVSDTNED